MSANKNEDNKLPQGEIAAKNAFSKWVYRLEGQVAVLEEEVVGGDLQHITRQLQTYQSEVQLLHDHADKNNIDISTYDTHFTNIYQHMHSLEVKVKQRAQRQTQFPWYDVLRFIGTIASIVVSFFNPPLANAIDKVTLLLPSGRGPGTWLLPETASSLQDQPYKPVTPLRRPVYWSPAKSLSGSSDQTAALATYKFSLLPPAPEQSSLPKKYTLSELRSLYPASQATSTTDTSSSTAKFFAKPAPTTDKLIGATTPKVPLKPVTDPKPPLTTSKFISTTSAKIPIKPVTDPKPSSTSKFSGTTTPKLPIKPVADPKLPLTSSKFISTTSPKVPIKPVTGPKPPASPQAPNNTSLPDLSSVTKQLVAKKIVENAFTSLVPCASCSATPTKRSVSIFSAFSTKPKTGRYYCAKHFPQS